MLVIPDFAQPVLSSFAPVFYHPTYQRFLVLTLAAILTTGRRTVANLLRTAGDLAPGHPSSYHRVLSRRRWSSPELARLLIGFILDHGIPEGPVALAATTPSTSIAAPRSTARAAIATRCARPIPTRPIAGGTNGSS